MSDSLGTVVMDALKIRDELKAGGLSGPELDGALETVLRDTWPKPEGRTEPWRDLCANCRDYGLVMRICPGDASCGRPKAHAEHEYGVPCWCPRGRGFHEKQTPTPDDAMTLAAKPKKAPSRWGR